jgi:4-amino-4-deoxy-L-arabinose transferase-like glycosyltransferase
MKGFIDIHNIRGYLNTKKRNEIIILLLCILIGFALRLYTFDQKSLWLDEVHTFNESRDDLKGQIEFYKVNSSHLHPPLFFVLTHLFYPFTKPERDLRIIPLIFGTLSIPVIYLLAKQFSARIALPCALSLAFMVYNISLSQDGRSYSFLMFVAMASLYLFVRHLKTSKKRYLPLVAFLFSILFYTSYSSIPFITLSQVLWFYRPNKGDKKPALSSFLILNGIIILFCLPWILFVAINYKGQPVADPFHTESPGSFWYILYGVLHDWVPYAPLMMISIILFILFPFFSKDKKNAFILLALFVFPIGGLYLYCTSLHITHFISSRYFINFLPLFLITLYLSLEAIEFKFERLKKFIRFRLIFVILLILSNLIILPFYYRSEKQDIRGLVTYLKGHLQDGDKIFLELDPLTPGILHYFGAYPKYRHHLYTGKRISEKEIELQTPFVYKNRTFIIYHHETCCDRYVANGSRLWIIVKKSTAKKFKESSPAVLKGYFDGSFLTVERFPIDGSLYLFLWDPKSPEEKGIDIPIE